MPERPGQTSTVLRAERVWLAAFFCALVLYWLTASRVVQWQDSGWQQCRIASGELLHPDGLALVHPIQHWLGRLFALVLPVEPAFAATLVSVVAAAVAVANIAATVRNHCAALIPVVASAGAYALAHTIWQEATHTESYAATAALLTTEWLLLERYFHTRRGHWLLGVALFNGLGVANHMLMVLGTPIHAAIAIDATRRGRLSISGLAAAVGCWVAGSLPYSTLIVATAMQDGWAEALYSAAFGEYRSEVLNTALDRNTFVLTGAYLVYNLPNLTIPLALYALFGRVTRGSGLVRLLAFECLVYLLFLARYRVVDQYMFYFPLYASLAILGGIGLHGALRHCVGVRRRMLIAAVLVTTFWSPALYAGAAVVARAVRLYPWMVGNKPYREGYWSFYAPWGVGKNFTVELSEAVRGLVGNRGLVIITDSSIAHGLEYDLIVGRIAAGVEFLRVKSRPDPDEVVEVLAAITRHRAAQGSIVLVPINREEPELHVPGLAWERVGDIYRLRSFAPSATTTSPTQP